MATTVEVPSAPAKSRVAATKQKKAKGSSPKATAPAHPPYFQMIKEAILALKDRTGSSPRAIAKYIEEHNKGVLPPTFKKILATQLKNSATRGKLVKVKASFKLSESSKKTAVVEPKPKVSKDKKEKPVVKKVAAKKSEKKPKEKKSVSLKRKATPLVSAATPKKKKSVAVASKVKSPKKIKKMTPAKPKQPKSIKSPAAKKAKKV